MQAGCVPGLCGVAVKQRKIILPPYGAGELFWFCLLLDGLKAHEHGCDLGAGGASLRGEHVVANTVDDALHRHPANCFIGPIGDLGGVVKAQLAATLRF